MSMTENEANLLEKLHELANDTEVDMYSVANLNFFFEESANTIRKLIEEIQQYRAIGTPAEIYEKIGGLDVELGKYYSIGTVEEFKALKEKNEPKKTVSFDYKNGTINYGCSVCKRKIISKINGEWCGGTLQEYCDRCGQKLDWS